MQLKANHSIGVRNESLMNARNSNEFIVAFSVCYTTNSFIDWKWSVKVLVCVRQCSGMPPMSFSRRALNHRSLAITQRMRRTERLRAKVKRDGELRECLNRKGKNYLRFCREKYVSVDIHKALVYRKTL